MSSAASQAWAFYREVAKTRSVWTVRDEGGYPAPENPEGYRAQPFWSSRSRVEKIIRTVPAYAAFTAEEIEWDKFCRTWAPSLAAEGLRIGVNWSGKRAVGYDLPVQSVVDSVQACIDRPED